jgi:hypothetical protein
MLQAPLDSYPSGESGGRNVVASWVIAILLLSVGGLFIGVHDRGMADSPRLHPAFSAAPSSAIGDALGW